MANHRRMVTMIAPNEFIRFVEADTFNRETLHRRIPLNQASMARSPPQILFSGFVSDIRRIGQLAQSMSVEQSFQRKAQVIVVLVIKKFTVTASMREINDISATVGIFGSKNSVAEPQITDPILPPINLVLLRTRRGCPYNN